jgi:hypothetical protein
LESLPVIITEFPSTLARWSLVDTRYNTLAPCLPTSKRKEGTSAGANAPAPSVTNHTSPTSLAYVNTTQLLAARTLDEVLSICTEHIEMPTMNPDNNSGEKREVVCPVKYLELLKTGVKQFIMTNPKQL